MATLTLQVENSSILTHLKAVLKTMRGVKILSTNNVLSPEMELEDVPNAVTVAAMKEAECGKDAGVVSTDSLESFMDSME